MEGFTGLETRRWGTKSACADWARIETGGLRPGERLRCSEDRDRPGTWGRWLQHGEVFCLPGTARPGNGEPVPREAPG
jgi:hypothetical protein